MEELLLSYANFLNNLPDTSIQDKTKKTCSMESFNEFICLFNDSQEKVQQDCLDNND